jgi:hypothetical protein
MFRFVDEWQFNSMALELDDGAHFAAGIAPRDVSATTPNTASRIAGPNHGNGGTRRFGQPKPGTPAEKLSLVEHLPSARERPKHCGYFLSRTLRSFFRANVYLRPASATTF